MIQKRKKKLPDRVTYNIEGRKRKMYFVRLLIRTITHLEIAENVRFMGIACVLLLFICANQPYSITYLSPCFFFDGEKTIELPKCK